MPDELAAQIDALDLSARQKMHLKNRWLGQLNWFSNKSANLKRLYHRLKLTSILGGVLVTAAASMISGYNPNSRLLQRVVPPITIVLGVAIAAANSMEDFFGPKELYLNYRKTSELLLSEGCLYFNSAGPYRGKTHANAYTEFVERVESLITNDVKEFVALKSQEQQKKSPEDAESDLRENLPPRLQAPTYSAQNLPQPPANLTQQVEAADARERALAKLGRKS